MARERSIGIERGWRIFGGSIVSAGALAIAGCGGGNKAEGPTLTFDDLGGGSPIIQVYPGVKNISADRQSNGFYRDGDEVAADCKTLGRTVVSHPEVGEEARASEDWIRLKIPDRTEYATAVYVEDPEKLLAQLDEC